MIARVLLVRSGAFFTSRLARTASALRELGAEVHILGWNRGNDDQDAPFRKKLKSEGHPVDEVWVGQAPPARGVYGIPKRLQYMWAAACYIREEGPFDTVHAIDLDSALPAALACSLGWHTGHLVYDIADYIERYYTIPNALGTLIAQIGKGVMRKADVLVVPDENRRSGIPSECWSKTAIVTNAPDIDDTLVEELRGREVYSNEALDVFYYGSFSEDRGIDLLLQAAVRVDDVHFWFAGWGKLTGEVKRAAQAHDHVHFLGRLSHEEVLCRAAEMDLICMAYDSSYEVNRTASPNKLFEAMAVGKPVIVARNTSIDQLVEAHDLGWVIDYASEDVIRLMHTIDRDDIQRRGANAASKYEEYKWETSKLRLQNAYQSMMS